MRELAIKILEYLRSDMMKETSTLNEISYSKALREDYITALTNKLTLYIGDSDELIQATKVNK